MDTELRQQVSRSHGGRWEWLLHTPFQISEVVIASLVFLQRLLRSVSTPALYPYLLWSVSFQVCTSLPDPAHEEVQGVGEALLSVF